MSLDCVGSVPKTQNIQPQEAQCGGCLNSKCDGDEWE